MFLHVTAMPYHVSVLLYHHVIDMLYHVANMPCHVSAMSHHVADMLGIGLSFSLSWLLINPCIQGPVDTNRLLWPITGLYCDGVADK